MANNRLYLFDPVSGEAVMIGKSLGDGWYCYPDVGKPLAEFFVKVNMGNVEELGDAASYGLSALPTRLRLVTENEKQSPELPCLTVSRSGYKMP